MSDQKPDQKMAINMKTEVDGDLEEVITKTTQALSLKGFGVLTRIDLHVKLKEKLGKTIAPAVILGVCNPGLAYETYLANSDVASVMPCNAVIREVRAGRMSVELARPSELMKLLGDSRLIAMVHAADRDLAEALELIRA